MGPDRYKELEQLGSGSKAGRWPGLVESSMSSTQFSGIEGFLRWFGEKGNEARFPLPRATEGWEVVLKGGEEPSVSIISPYYNVVQLPKYFAPKIQGIILPFAGEQVSGIIKFGFKGEKPAIISRRRLVVDDVLQKEEEIIDVITIQPDRVEEPVVIVVVSADIEHFKKLSAEIWLAFIDSVRDGVETEAIRTLRKYLASH